MVQENPGSTRIGADGKRLGGLQRGGYFSASIDPGEHDLCALAHIGLWNHVSLYELKVKADDRILSVFPAYRRQAKGADFDFTTAAFLYFLTSVQALTRHLSLMYM